MINLIDFDKILAATAEYIDIINFLGYSNLNLNEFAAQRINVVIMKAIVAVNKLIIVVIETILY